MNTNLVNYQLHSGAANIQLNRPDKKNALNQAMYAELNHCLDSALADNQISSVILSGHEDFFTTGNDIQDFILAKKPEDFEVVSNFITKISTYSKPLIAAINGPCVGIGTTLLLHCDLIYAGPESYFHMPFSQLGLTPEAGASYLLPALMGHQKASQYLLLGEAFKAQTALELGLINAIINKSDVLSHAIEKAKILAQFSPESLYATKKLLKKPHQAKTLSAIEQEMPIFFNHLQKPHAQAAFRSFLKSQNIS
jgi:enoyl-CoA hydratase/carnithine racemase